MAVIGTSTRFPTLTERSSPDLIIRHAIDREILNNMPAVSTDTAEGTGLGRS